MLILFRITSMLMPHRFPLDQKEANHRTNNHQRYHNSCNGATSYSGAFATTAAAASSTTATITGIASACRSIVAVTRNSSRRWSQRWRSIWWSFWGRAVAKGVATCLEITYALQLIRNRPTELVICDI
uniref:Uncharacterized protein n=1 Tax=Arundo donax TaxID=35708 RepID=A0A0A9H8X9_ARUDO